MERIDSVAVVGAGALGLMYAQPLKALLGDRLYFVAGGSRRERLASTVFSINGGEERFAVRSFDASGDPPGLVLVAVKNYDLPELGPQLARLCGPDTVVVSVLNGIDSEEALERAVPGSAVLYCCVLGMDAVKSGHLVSFTSRGRMLLGAKGNGPSEALDAVLDLLGRAGLSALRSQDIHRDIWWKWMINIGVNQVSAVTGANYGKVRTDPDAVALMDAAMREVVALAQAEGIDLSEEDIVKFHAVLNGLGAEGKTSMLQDMEHRRKTEVESFGGRLVRLARERGVPAPVNETLYRIVSVRERSY